MRKKEMQKQKISLVEKQLLSLFFCGHYISTKDIVDIGKKMKIELDFKSRKIILQKLFIGAKKEDKAQKLADLFCDLLDRRNKELIKYIELYPSSKDIFQIHIQKANSTKLLLQQESRRNPYA